MVYIISVEKAKTLMLERREERIPLHLEED